MIINVAIVEDHKNESDLLLNHLYHYSDVIGWTNTETFGMFSALLPVISVIFVVIGNMIVGHLMDHTHTAQGKARPFLLLSATLVTLAIVFLFFVPQNSSPTNQMICIALSYNFYYAIAYPIFFTAHSSMVSLSTRNSAHRGMLATFSNASGVAAVGIGASILIPMFLQQFLFVLNEDGGIDAASSYHNWHIVMVFLCIITFLSILLEYYFTREHISEENQKLNILKENIPMKQQIKTCVSSHDWWIIIIYFLLFQFGCIVKNGSMSYYSSWMFEGIDPGTAMGMLGLNGGIPVGIWCHYGGHDRIGNSSYQYFAHVKRL